MHVQMSFSQLLLLHESAHDNQLLILNVLLSWHGRLDYLLWVIFMQVHVGVSCRVVYQGFCGVELVTTQGWGGFTISLAHYAGHLNGHRGPRPLTWSVGEIAIPELNLMPFLILTQLINSILNIVLIEIPLVAIFLLIILGRALPGVNKWRMSTSLVLILFEVVVLNYLIWLFLRIDDLPALVIAIGLRLWVS